MDTESLIAGARLYVDDFYTWSDADEPTDEGPAMIIAIELLDALARRLEHSDKHRRYAHLRARRLHKHCKELAEATELSRAKFTLRGYRIGELERANKKLRTRLDEALNADA